MQVHPNPTWYMSEVIPMTENALLEPSFAEAKEGLECVFGHWDHLTHVPGWIRMDLHVGL